MTTKIFSRDSKALDIIFRISIFMTMAGHGFHGIFKGGKQGWLQFFAGPDAMIGFNLFEPHAWTIMPIIGIVDILIGLYILIRPSRYALLHAGLWAFVTAFFRPLADATGLAGGHLLSGLLERTYNFGPALILLSLSLYGTDVLSALNTFKGFFVERVRFPRIQVREAVAVRDVLALLISIALVGHAIYCLVDGSGTVGRHLVAFGHDKVAGLQVLGVLQLVAAALVLIGRRCSVIVAGVLAVTLGVEFLYIGDIIAGHGHYLTAIFEIIERGGKYMIPVAILVLNRATKA